MIKQVCKWLEVLLASVRRFAAAPWYPFLVAVLVACDMFIPFVPNDALLISAVNASPKKWFPIVLIVSAGAMLGTMGLASCVAFLGPAWLTSFFPSVFESAAFKTTAGYMDEYGVWGVFFGAVSPMVIHPFVFLALITKMSNAQLFAAVFMGRVVKWACVAFLTAKGSDILRKRSESGSGQDRRDSEA